MADAEVEYKDHISNTIYVAFKITQTDKDFLKDANIIIWTTTPWTIPANKALAYNKSLEYSLVEISELDNFKEKRIVVAKNLLEKVIKSCEIKKYKLIKNFKGEDLKSTICSHPFKKIGFDYNIPNV